MKSHNTIIQGLAFVGLLAILSGCASLTGFQTGRTVGRNKGEILASINASQTPKFDLTASDSNGTVPRLYFPNLEASGRYGIVDRLDVGLRMNTNFNIAGDVKYQLLGNQESPVAMSAGFGVGTFGLFAALWNVQVPLYFSLHPSKTVDIYVNPRFIAQFASGDFNGTLKYLGGNAGILVGKRTKFGLDVGVYDLNVKRSDSVTLLNFGIGVKFPLGRFDED